MRIAANKFGHSSYPVTTFAPQKMLMNKLAYSLEHTPKW